MCDHKSAPLLLPPEATHARLGIRLHTPFPLHPETSREGGADYEGALFGVAVACVAHVNDS
jgi:hypothetical protein